MLLTKATVDRCPCVNLLFLRATVHQRSVFQTVWTIWNTVSGSQVLVFSKCGHAVGSDGTRPPSFNFRKLFDVWKPECWVFLDVSSDQLVWVQFELPSLGFSPIAMTCSWGTMTPRKYEYSTVQSLKWEWFSLRRTETDLSASQNRGKRSRIGAWVSHGQGVPKTTCPSKRPQTVFSSKSPTLVYWSRDSAGAVLA